MKHIETEIERACRAYARERGWVCWKNEKNGNKGIPDDTFLSPDGMRFLLIEFKKLLSIMKLNTKIFIII